MTPLAAVLVAAAVVAIRGVAVVDVETGTVLPDRTVVIEGERIARVAPAAEVELGADATVVDGAGLYLIPGLIDAHVHLVHPDTFAPLLLANGVTLARDLGGATRERVALRGKLARGEAVGPELRVTGAIVDGDPPVWAGFSEAVDTDDEARAAVQKLAEAGVDEIKVYSLLAPGPFRAAVAEAHARGLRAVGHVPESVPLEDAIEAGLDEIQHLSGVPRWLEREAGEAPRGLLDLSGWLLLDRVPPERVRALGARIAAKKTVLCPTLVVLDRLTRIKDKKLREDPRLVYVPPWLRFFWETGGPKIAENREALAPILRLTGDLHRAGVVVIAGTDIANPFLVPGFSLHEELELLVRAGLTPAEALRAATLAPARALRLDADRGAVAAGKLASLVLLEANPLEDIRHTRKIRAVFLRGRMHDRAALDKLLEDVKAAAAPPAPAGKR